MHQKEKTSDKCTFDQIKIPPLYGVYLLRSLTKKNSFYIGSTPDPYRRLRQHNGELTRGGAYRTRRNGYRPWRMVLFVHGFPSNVSALQFEHAWQHSYQTRHIPVSKRRHSGKRNTGSGTTADEKLANCRLLLCSKSFRRLGIKVAIFDKEIYQLWIRNKFHILIPDYIHMDIEIEDTKMKAANTEGENEKLIKGGNYSQIKQFKEDIYFSEEKLQETSIAKTNTTDLVNKCSICAKEIDNISNLVVYCIYKDCMATYHLECWAQCMLKEKQPKDADIYEKEPPIKPIIPIRGHCLKCKRVNFWNTVVRNALQVQKVLSTQTIDKTHVEEL